MIRGGRESLPISSVSSKPGLMPEALPGPSLPTGEEGWVLDLAFSRCLKTCWRGMGCLVVEGLVQEGGVKP